MARKQKKSDGKLTQNEKNLLSGIEIIKIHSLFGNLSIKILIDENNKLSKGTAAVSYESGDILVNKNESHTPQEWSHIIAHCMLHLCFDHFKTTSQDKKIWNTACDISVKKYIIC